MVSNIRRMIEKVAIGMAAFLMLGLVILAFIQVMLRNFFHIGFNAVEEFMRNGVLWIAFVGAVLTTLRGRHIAIDILPRFLKDRPKRIIYWIISLIVALICLILMYYGIQFMLLEMETGAVIGGFCPAWIVELIIPVGFLLLAITSVLRAVENNQQDNRPC